MGNTVHTIILIATAVVVTFLLRALPFIIFGGSRQMPAKVKQIADGLPPAIISVLVIYCLKDCIVVWGTNTIASLVAIACVIGIHLWKRNTLLSIAVGTIIYMVLIRV